MTSHLKITVFIREYKKIQNENVKKRKVKPTGEHNNNLVYGEL